MLSRVAESLYWLSRNLERAEHIARFIEVNWHLMLDMPSADDDAASDAQWEPLVRITGEHHEFAKRYDKPSQQNVIRYLALDTQYANSIISCLRNTRENARAVRDIIPPDMWEQVNILHHFVEDTAKAPESMLENPYDFCERLKLHCIMLCGIADGWMAHGEGWHFFRIGRLLERADKTSRILDVKYFILLPDPEYVGMALDDIQWAALLRSASSFEEFRHRYGRLNPANVAEFLLLDRDYPRSALYCLTGAVQSLHAISGTRYGDYQNEAEKRLGRLCAELGYESIDEVIAKGLHEFVDQLQTRMNEVHNAVNATFFHLPEPQGQSAEQ